MQDGQRGHLEGLASVYCELLMAPFGDVLNALENARQAAWVERSPQNRSGVCSNRGHRGSSAQGGLPNSHSQPIYVPGKYSVRTFSVFFFSFLSFLLTSSSVFLYLSVGLYLFCNRRSILCTQFVFAKCYLDFGKLSAYPDITLWLYTYM